MKNKKGFTLVELMGVIVVIGIITLIAVPIYNNTSKKVRQKEYENVITAIEVASERYADKTAKIRFSVQELIDKGEYEADNESGDVLSPIDQKRLNCHIINVDYENENYDATFTDEDDCDVANGLKDTFGVNIEAEDESGNKWTNKETRWTRDNVTLTASINETGLPEELKGKEYSTIYDWFAGNVKVNNGTNSNTYKVEAQTILNAIYQVRVTIHTEEKDYTATGSIKMQIDKQSPLIYEVKVDKAEEWIKAGSTKAIDIQADDYNGSGIKGYYIGTDTSCPTAEESYGKNNKSSANGTYIACAMDNVGNISESHSFQIEKIDSALPTVRFEASDGKTTGQMHQGSFTLNLKSNETGYTGSTLVYKYGTDKNNVETIGNSIQLAPPATTITYYGKVCNATACSSIIEYKAVLDEEPPVPVITASDGIASGKWHPEEFTLNVTSNTSHYHGSDITYYYRTSSTKHEIKNQITVTHIGTSNYYIQTCNQSGLCSKEIKYESKLDAIPSIPTITASDGIASKEWHPTDFKLHFSSWSQGSQITYYYGTDPDPNNLKKAGNDIIMTHDIYNKDYYVKACNESGQCSDSSKAYGVNYDQDSPFLSIETETSGLQGSDIYPITLTIQLSDDTSALKAWQFYTESDYATPDPSIEIEGNPKEKTITKTITLSDAGSYCVRVFDMAKNYSDQCVDFPGPDIMLKDFEITCDFTPGLDYTPYYEVKFGFDIIDWWTIDLNSEGKYTDWYYQYSTSPTPSNYWKKNTTNASLAIGQRYYLFVKAYDTEGNYSITMLKRFALTPSSCTKDITVGASNTKKYPCTPGWNDGICGSADLCTMYANSIQWHKASTQSKKDCYYRKSQDIGKKWDLNFNSGNGTWHLETNGNELYTWCGLKPATYWSSKSNVDLSDSSYCP